jgi:hypothetical protein
MPRATYPIEVLTVMVEEMTVFEVQLFDQRACVRQRSGDENSLMGQMTQCVLGRA